MLNVTDRSTPTSLGFLRKYCEIWNSEPEKLTYFVLLLRTEYWSNLCQLYHACMFPWNIWWLQKASVQYTNLIFLSLWSKHGASLPWTVTRFMDMKTESTRTWSVSTTGSLGFLLKMIYCTTSLVPYISLPDQTSKICVSSWKNLSTF